MADDQNFTINFARKTKDEHDGTRTEDWDPAQYNRRIVPRTRRQGKPSTHGSDMQGAPLRAQ